MEAQPQHRKLFPVGWGSAFFLVAVIAGACGSQAGRWFRPSVQPDVVSPPILRVPARSLSIGEVWESSSYPWTLPITNTSDQPVEIESFGKSCNCTRIQPSQLTIPPGEVREIRLKLDLTYQKEQPTGTIRGFAVDITPWIKGATGRQREGWQVTAQVRSAIRLGVRSVSFASLSRLAQTPEPITVDVTDLVGLERISAFASTPDFLVDLPRPSHGAQKHAIRIRPKGSLPVGPHRATLTILPWLTRGEKLSAVELPLYCDILPDVEAVLPTMIFGVQRIGTAVEESITLRSRTGKLFEVLSTGTPDKSVTVSKLGNSTTANAYQVRQQILRPNDQRTDITFQIPAADGSIETLPVEAVYFGRPANSEWGS